MVEQLSFMTDTLASAKQKVMAGKWLVEGITCPCCAQFCKVYNRQIHSTMAYVLIRFYRLALREGMEAYYHVSRLCPDRIGSGDFAKMAMWGLMDEMAANPKDTVRRTSGMWKLTANGIAFVKREQKIPRYCRVYNDEIMGFSDDDMVDIRECLKEKFDYQELMSDEG